jgi:hypothetical protein
VPYCCHRCWCGPCRVLLLLLLLLLLLDHLLLLLLPVLGQCPSCQMVLLLLLLQLRQMHLLLLLLPHRVPHRAQQGPCSSMHQHRKAARHAQPGCHTKRYARCLRNLSTPSGHAARETSTHSTII